MAAGQHPHSTLDQRVLMIVNYGNTNGARTMAFIIMVKVTHVVFTTHHSKDHNFLHLTME